LNSNQDSPYSFPDNRPPQIHSGKFSEYGYEKKANPNV